MVIDGITIGHPCCASHNCHHPLANNHHRYCPDHASLNTECAIVGCNASTIKGTMTCHDPLHQNVEHVKKARGEGRFQLKDRLARQRVAHPNDSVAEDINLSELVDVDADLEEFVLGEEGHVRPNSDKGGTAPAIKVPVRKLRAQFGRKRTHNEHIIVAPCGIVLARATFFGAEAVSSVIVSALFTTFNLCAI